MKDPASQYVGAQAVPRPWQGWPALNYSRSGFTQENSITSYVRQRWTSRRSKRTYIYIYTIAVACQVYAGSHDITTGVYASYFRTRGWQYLNNTCNGYITETFTTHYIMLYLFYARTLLTYDPPPLSTMLCHWHNYHIGIMQNVDTLVLLCVDLPLSFTYLKPYEKTMS